MGWPCLCWVLPRDVGDGRAIWKACKERLWSSHRRTSIFAQYPLLPGTYYNQTDQLASFLASHKRPQNPSILALAAKEMWKLCIYYVPGTMLSPSHIQPNLTVTVGPTSTDSTNLGLKMFGKKCPESSPKQNLYLLCAWQLFTEHLYCIRYYK